MKLIKGLTLIAGLCLANIAVAKDYFVSSNGNDLWSGTLKAPNAKLTDGPFKTLTKAQAAVRAFKNTSAYKSPITVNIAAGTYYLTQKLTFSALDSGAPGKEITWQGDEGALVTISAGKVVNCAARANIYMDCPLAVLPESTAYYDTSRIKGNTPKFELFVNNQRLDLARWPDKDWAHIKTPLNSKTQFSAMETIPELTGDIQAAQVHIFAGNDWYDQYVGITSVNATTNAVTLSAPVNYALATGRRFYIQNSPSLLNAPGEWIYSTTNKKITFIPPSGVTPSSIIVSSLPNILLADGVSNLTLKNITFQHSTSWALKITNATNVILDKLDVNNVGGAGLQINKGQNVQLTNSKIHHVGGDGVGIYGGDVTTLTSPGHVIYNNYIHHTGTTVLTYSPGINVNGVGVRVTNNLLEQGGGSAILFTGNDHVIEKNEIHHFCLHASDCGAIYAGRNWSWRGNAIRNNYIHDIVGLGMVSADAATNKAVYKSPYDANAVYLDDGMSGVEVSSNIFENAGGAAVFIGGGRDNKVFNNYINTKAYAIYIDSRDNSNNQTTLTSSPYKTSLWKQRYPDLALPIMHPNWPEGNKIERNIIVTAKSDGRSLLYRIPADSTVIADNLVWSTAGGVAVDYKVIDSNGVSQNAKPWLQWVAEGVEQGSIVTDPCVTVTNKKMTSCNSSVLSDYGFNAVSADMGLIQ